jgi:ribonuclease HI
MYEVALRTDGGIRHGNMAFGYVALDLLDENIILFKGCGSCGRGTSNISEYKGLIAGLMGCLAEKVEIVHIILDSQLVVRQINGSFETKNEELNENKNKVMELLSRFKHFTIKWEPRENNKLADDLVNQVFFNKTKRGKRCKKSGRNEK